MKKLMKISVSIILLVLLQLQSKAQKNYAKSCGSGCNFVTAQTRMDNACGSHNDYTFTISNNTYEPLDIKLFTETPDGEWISQGLLTDVPAGKVKKDCFWGCKLTGRYIIYYRISGSNDVFPTQSELKGKGNSGYGQY